MCKKTKEFPFIAWLMTPFYQLQDENTDLLQLPETVNIQWLRETYMLILITVM